MRLSFSTFGLWMVGVALTALPGPVTAQSRPDAVAKEQMLARGMGYLPTPPELIPSLPQTRKYRGFLPASVNLEEYFPPPGDQGGQNACVGWAVGYAARGYYSSAVDKLAVTRPENVPSPSYIYDLAISQDGPSDCLRGMTFSDAFRILKDGSVSLAQKPYDPLSCAPPPSADLRKEAKKFRIRDWRFIDPQNLDTIKGELAKGHPVIFGMLVRADFPVFQGQEIYSASSAQILDPDMGHAMVIVGYDETRQALRIINSWGPSWGDGGYAWIDYDTFRAFTHEAYAMRPSGKDPALTPTSEPLAPRPETTPAQAETEPPPLMPEPTVQPAAETEAAPAKTDVEPSVPPVQPAPKPVAPSVDPQPTPPVPTTTVEGLGLQCSKIAIANERGKRIARGFVANPEDGAKAQQALKDRADQFDIDVRPWPQCEALLTLDQSLAANDRPSVTVRGGAKALKKGDPLVIEVTSPRGPSHLHVAYIQADGSVVHLVQADAKFLQTVDGGHKLVFGDGQEGRQRFVVQAPFGAELIIALASRAPVFLQPRPQSENDRDFLTALRKALLWKPEASAPDRAVSAAMAAIVTTEN